MPKAFKKPMKMDERIMLAVVRAAELFKRKSSAVFSGYGLSFSQYNVLRVLDDSPDGQCSISDIARRLLVSVPNLSGIARRLEKAGFADRSRDPSDERRVILCLKKRGQKVLGKIEELQEQNIRQFLEDCSNEEKSVLLAQLKAMLTLDDDDGGISDRE